jgi:hypothetical protein
MILDARAEKRRNRVKEDGRDAVEIDHRQKDKLRSSLPHFPSSSSICLLLVSQCAFPAQIYTYMLFMAVTGTEKTGSEGGERDRGSGEQRATEEAIADSSFWGKSGDGRKISDTPGQKQTGC